MFAFSNHQHSSWQSFNDEVLGPLYSVQKPGRLEAFRAAKGSSKKVEDEKSRERERERA